MTNTTKVVNDLAAFVLELAAVGAFAWWGFTLTHGLAIRMTAGIAAPLAFLLVWGRWLAPRSDHRLDLPWLLLAKIAMFAAAAAALLDAGHPRLAAALGAAAILNLALATIWGRL